MICKYYQLGGFRPHIHWFLYDEKGLAKGIAGDDSPLRPRGKDSKAPVELALGIKISGTSHLLLTEEQVRIIAKDLRLQPPRSAPILSTEFESISPIYFHNPDELSKKLGVLKPKSHKGRTPVDSSQANKYYTSGEDGIQRGLFEHGRLLYQILQGNIEPRKYALENTPWTRSIQVFSFVFNTRSNDERPSWERLANPVVLDYGLSEANIPGLTSRNESSIHLKVSENVLLNQGTKKLEFKYGNTEILSRSSISSRIQAFFQEKTSHAHPTILIVHGEQVTRNILKNNSVDTSTWESGIKNLLGFETYKVKQEFEENGPSSSSKDPRLHRQPTADPRRAPSSTFHDDYEQRQNRSRSRSRSPHQKSSDSGPAFRRSPPRRSSDYSDHRAQDHPRVRTCAPVYIVDIQQLYIKLMQTKNGSESINKISKHLGVADVAGWCAGNEAVLILDIWNSMISGPAIDEQRALRAPIPQTQKSQSSTQPSIPLPTDESDEERDPNDIVQVSGPSDMMYDDDSDYGQSDSD